MHIKSLEWEGFGVRLRASAFGIKSFYLITGQPGDWTLTSPGETSHICTSGYTVQSAAKRAAQIDFEHRIRTQLQICGA